MLIFAPNSLIGHQYEPILSLLTVWVLIFVGDRKEIANFACHFKMYYYERTRKAI